MVRFKSPSVYLLQKTTMMKCLAKLHIFSLFSIGLINSIIHEHLCKIHFLRCLFRSSVLIFETGAVAQLVASPTADPGV